MDPWYFEVTQIPQQVGDVSNNTKDTSIPKK